LFVSHSSISSILGSCLPSIIPVMISSIT
jgi:hypothetical protein